VPVKQKRFPASEGVPLEPDRLKRGPVGAPTCEGRSPEPSNSLLGGPFIQLGSSFIPVDIGRSVYSLGGPFIKLSASEASTILALGSTADLFLLLCRFIYVLFFWLGYVSSFSIAYYILFLLFFPGAVYRL